MATMALPTEAELSQLSKNDLIGVVQTSMRKLQAQSGRIRKLGKQAKDLILEYSKQGAFELADYAAAGLAAGAAGMWMGSIQAKIDAGEEGYDEESLLAFGVDKDLAATIVAVGTAFYLHRRASSALEAKDEEGHKNWEQAAHYVKQGAAGLLAGWAYRMSYEYAMAPPEEEEGDQQVA